MQEHHEQWNLGQLIDALERCPKDNAVRFDFCMTAPTTLDSYRGYYEDLALGWQEQPGYPEPTVGALLKTLKEQLGTTVHGYKGGDYTVDRRQWVYVANYSETSSTCIVGVNSGYYTVIRTICSELT